MKDVENRKLQAFTRSHNYFDQVAGEFSPTGKAKQTATRLGLVIAAIQEKSAAHTGNVGLARQHTSSLADVRTALRDDLESINRAARIIGLQAEFPLPPHGNDQQLLDAARAFAANALPRKPAFLEHEMPDDFLDELAVNREALEAKIAEREAAVGTHVEAGAAMDDLFEEGMKLLHDLEHFMKNKFRDDAEHLAGWLRASHIQRAPRHKTPAAIPPPPGTGGNPGQPSGPGTSQPTT